MTNTKIAVKSGMGHAARRTRGNATFTMPKFAECAPTAKTCQFIAGEDHYMCGKPGFPYCEEHQKVCRVPYTPKPDSIHSDIRHTRPRRPRTVIGGKWS